MTTPAAPIVLFCDFGLPYTGQMKGRLVEELGSHAAEHQIIDLCHDAPSFDIRAGSVLLAAHADDFPLGSVFICVVDPGVGSKARKPGVVYAGRRWFVGPLNGLFEHVLRRWDHDGETQAYEIVWRPTRLSATFHGRDLFAPVAAGLALAGNQGIEGLVPLKAEDIRRPDYADDVSQVIYADGFGNLMTGIRWESLQDGDMIEVEGRILPRARTFSDVESGALFVYENAVGLVEISANLGNAQKSLGISVGTRVKIIKV